MKCSNAINFLDPELRLGASKIWSQRVNFNDLLAEHRAAMGLLTIRIYRERPRRLVQQSCGYYGGLNAKSQSPPASLLTFREVLRHSFVVTLCDTWR